MSSLVAVAAIATSSKGPKEKRSVRVTGEEGGGFTRPKASQGGTADDHSDSSFKKAVPSITKKKGKKKIGQVKVKAEGGPRTKKPPPILQDELSRLGCHLISPIERRY